MDVPPPIRTLLDWHQGRRSRGTPTVTVLAGPVNLGVRAWRGWAGSRPVLVVRAASNPDDLATAWVADALSASPGLDHARAWLARITSQDPAAVARDTGRMTRYDLERLWRSLPIDPAAPVARAAFGLLTAHAFGTPPDPAAFVHGVSAAGPTGAFRGICGLYPADRWPALLVVPAPGSPPGWFGRVVAFLETVATAVPALPVAAAAPRAECEALAADPRSHTAAVVREGLVAVEGLTAGELDARLRAAGVAPPPAAPTLSRLVADGVDDAGAAAFVEAARAVRNPTPADAASDFRSVHERFLFEQLESLPETAGLFRPNAALPFRHGPQEGEADLLAGRLKLVVEVDGGHYHLNQPQYRRDRRKDWLYQRHGYLVLRFLAEDVVDDLEAILATILEAVALRRGGRSPNGDRP